MVSLFSILRFLILILLCLFGPRLILAEEKNAVSQETYKVLERADTWLKQGKAKQAAQKLQRLQAQIQNNSFETAVVQQYLAYAHGEAGNLWAARQAAKSALASNLLSADAVHGLNYLAGQIALRQEDYRASANYLGQWLKQEPKADAQIHYMAGYAAFRARMSSAPMHLEKAIALKNNPPEEWIRLLLSIYIDRKQFSKAEPMVKKLIAIAPKKRKWWRYLSSLYAQQGLHDKALASTMLSFYSGHATREDVLQLVRLNTHQGYPAKAARLLESELENNRIPRSYENLKLLFNCWQLAREREKSRRFLAEAAKFASTGEDFALLGRLEMQQGKWSQAKNSLQKSLKKGRLKHKQHTRLWLGIAAFQAKDEGLARRSLQVLLDEPRVKQEAAYWLKRLDRSKNSAQNQHSIIPKS